MREKEIYMEEEKDTRGFDLKTEHFKTQLINIINGANLPPAMIFYILKDTLAEVKDLYDNMSTYQKNIFNKLIT
mgnify:CR=1 FL=1